MKIFVLLSRVPYPLEKGDKLRAFNQIKYLSEYHEIHLCALNDCKIHPDARKVLQPFCKSINIVKIPKIIQFLSLFKALFNGKPFQVAYFFNNKNEKKIHALIKEIQPDRIYCQLIRVAEYVKNQQIIKTLDYQDVLSKGIYRRIESTPFYLKPLFRSEYKRLLRYEADTFNYFNHKIIISNPDRELINHPRKNEIVVIPNGVDTNYFKPIASKKEFDLIFTGNMGYPPNINCVEFIVNKVIPLLVKLYPDVKFIIAGANPSQFVCSLKSENIIVTGWVDDIRECYSKSKIFFAPMQIGTGLQNKIMEAMAMKLPCVTSSLVNNALGATDKVDLFIGNTPEEYASILFSLLSDNEYAQKVGLSGQQFVMQNFNWKNMNENLMRIITS